MELLDRLEKALEGLWEGMFAGLFQAQIQPVEVAKRLTGKMDANQTRGINVVYVPNDYLVRLAPDTYAKFSMLCPRLLADLETYLKEHAKKQRYEVVAPISVRLEEGPEVKISDAEIVAATTKAVPTPAPAPAPAPVSTDTVLLRSDHTVLLQPTLALEVVEGEDVGARHPITDGMTLGRGADSTLVLPDRAVSRAHAQITRTPDGWTIRDLGSSNHTYVNGAPVDTSPLHPGDRIILGKTVLEVKG